MADDEGFTSIPVVDRFTHKVWKARKSGYEEAAKIFEKTPDENDDAFRPFLLDSSLWKAAVTDSNVAAQQEGIVALNAFLKFGGRDACVRSRGSVVTGLVEKALASARAATKANAVEALLLYIEGDVSAPIIEDLLPGLSNKQPKIVAATLAAFTAIFHNYGCKVVDPKPVLKTLPKAFGHADKNVRAEATNLSVELYRWLREAMKSMFWGDLKPTQQSDLEAQFEKIKSEPAPKQERLLRTQQEAMARAPPPGSDGMDEEEDAGEEVGEVDVFDLAEPQDILKGLPANFYDGVASSKWKERKEAVEALYAVANVPRIKDGDFNEINRCLAKCMKDANVAVVTQAAQCIEALGKGLRTGYAKHRATIMPPIMERLKEKKASVADALGGALDAVFSATSLSDCLEDIVAFLGNKNPQVKEGTMKFLVRCLRTTRSVPAKPEIQTIVDSAKKLLSESSEGLRSGGAEILGTVMKIIGERPMNPHLEGLDDIRKNKINEYFETAEVKAKEKSKPPPPVKPAPVPKKVPGGARKAPVKKTVTASASAPAAATRALSPDPSIAVVTRPVSRAPAKPTGLKATRGRPGGLASPRKPATAPIMPDEAPEEEPAPLSASAAPRGIRGGLAGRSLAKPGSTPIMPPESPTAASYHAPPSSFTAIERAELEELRVANERLTRLIEDMKQDRSKLLSENQELKNQNAGLIEDHTRDVLSIKAKETQLVRARSDAEATEQTNERLRRELERLKRALSRAEGLGAGGAVSPVDRDRIASPTHDDAGTFRDLGRTGSGPSPHSRPDSQASRNATNGNRISYASNLSEERENGEPAFSRAKLSPGMGYGSTGSSGLPSGRASPARGYRQTPQMPSSLHNNQTTDEAGSQGNYADRHVGYGDRNSGHMGLGMDRMNGMNSMDRGSTPTGGVESWKRAAEVTSQLKARIEQMKAKQGFR
ncbi:hypothetical protein BROUX41_003358 [Berkeleyomyces rouxiae]